ncbi:hypothetical protein LOK49_LG09G00436 [Camellia lanceoleosa]|uniref:Uncharacterized protein n=1 Tax=Camellia lanceoleosa TaxID=1840588 RepID=A0ACC0GEW5_9ERIC|nr:hypothetical protein LOK49_LG09G00436 [Camellia lanceoleosa]
MWVSKRGSPRCTTNLHDDDTVDDNESVCISKRGKRGSPNRNVGQQTWITTVHHHPPTTTTTMTPPVFSSAIVYSPCPPVSVIKGTTMNPDASGFMGRWDLLKNGGIAGTRIGGIGEIENQICEHQMNICAVWVGILRYNPIIQVVSLS